MVSGERMADSGPDSTAVPCVKTDAKWRTHASARSSSHTLSPVSRFRAACSGFGDAGSGLTAQG